MNVRESYSRALEHGTLLILFPRSVQISPFLFRRREEEEVEEQPVLCLLRGAVRWRGMGMS